MKSFYSKRVIKILLYDKQKGKCNQCHEPFTMRALEVDHIIPRAGGGSDVPSNFQLLCKPCNQRKLDSISAGSQYTLFDAPRETLRCAPAVEDKERKRLQRERARLAGKCTICCKRKARKDKTTCKICYERNKAALYRRRKAQH